jgi:hypothetical protein
MTNIKVELASPPDREKLVVQVMVGNEQIVELNQEGKSLELEVYGRRDGKPWIIEYSHFIRALLVAKEKLVGLGGAEQGDIERGSVNGERERGSVNGERERGA